MRRLAVLALVVTLLVSGCTTVGEDEPPATAPPPPRDAALRPVSLPYGDGLPYVPAETAAQAICQALSPERWEELLDGPVHRAIEEDSLCAITGPGMVVRIRMATVVIDQIVPAAEITAETIAGHQARLGVDVTGPVGVVVLLPVGEQVVANQIRSGTRPTLYVTVSADPPGPPDGLGLIRELFAALLPVLVHDGPKVPVPDSEGNVAYTPTAPLPGTRFVDLPGPVRGLILCTALISVTNPSPGAADVEANVRGGCDTVVPVPVAVTAFDVYLSDEATQFTVAGRPAWQTALGRMAVDLDHAVLELAGEHITREFAEQLIGKLGEL